jgi:SAM-dependent methyltransferase
MNTTDTGSPADDIGAETLRRMAGLEAYNRWLHDRFDAYLGSRILEIGSGIGNQTRYFADRDRVIASDIDPYYVNLLQSRFGARTNVRMASFRFPLTEADRSLAHVLRLSRRRHPFAKKGISQVAGQAGRSRDVEPQHHAF